MSNIAVNETGRRFSDLSQSDVDEEEPPLSYKQTCKNHTG